VAPFITAISSTNGGMRLTWISFTNGSYQVEYKSSLSSTSWLTLENSITATGDTTSFMDTGAAAAARFYRVGLLP
jgi:hypothetical protein